MRMRFYAVFLIVFVLLLSSLAVGGAVSRTMASPANDFEVSTESELADALAQVQDGQTIRLNTGSFGDLSIVNRDNATGITLAAGAGEVPEFTSVNVQNSSGWTLSSLHVNPRYESGAGGKKAVSISGSDNIFEDSFVSYADDVSSWSAADWLAKTGNGISLSGSGHVVRNNVVTNVAHGISSSADQVLISGNSVINFRGDGMRTLGDDAVIEYNLIKNCYDVDDNHDDGIQSWSNGEGGPGSGVVKNVVLRGNIIINYDDPNQPLRGPLQGMGFFDGFFENWTIENNVVIVDHWHGISLYGTRDSRVINNTVLDIADGKPGPTWILIHDHKDGTHSSNVAVRNNLTHQVSLPESASAEGVVSESNIIVGDRSVHFVDADAFDFHLLVSSPAIDAGTSTDAPSIDIEGISRPQGAGIDVGAYEYTDAPPTPATMLTNTPTNTPMETGMPTTPMPSETPAPTMEPTEPAPGSTPTAESSPTSITATTPAPEGTPQPGTVTGRIFVDENGNGVHDGGESMLGDVAVLLLDAATNGQGIRDTATTDASGRYRFENVSPGSYLLNFVLPPGYGFGSQAQIALTIGTAGVAAPMLDVVASDLKLYVPVIMQ